MKVSWLVADTCSFSDKCKIYGEDEYSEVSGMRFFQVVSGVCISV